MIFGGAVARAAVLLAILLAAGSAAAGAPRPYDAPLSAAPGAVVPPVTPEYVPIEDAGIRLVYTPRARERAQSLLTRAVAMRVELGVALGRDVLSSVEIRVAEAPAQLPGLSPMDVPSGASVVAFRDQHLVVMSLSSAGETPDLEERLRHALAHLALDEALAGHDVPRWLHEGFALHFAGEDTASRAEALTLAALQDRLLGLREIEARFPDGGPPPALAAAEAADFARFLASRPGHELGAVVERLRRGEPFERALPLAVGADLDTLETRWRQDMARRYSFMPVFTGATLLWVVVAAGVLMRRRRLAAARRAEERPLPAAERLSQHEPVRPHLAEEDDDLAQAMPPDPDVPKVEHGGRWYTLH